MAQTRSQKEDQQPHNLQELLSDMAEAANDQEQVSLGRIVDTVGRRSFAPLLLMVGALIMSPISGIPGLPTTLSLLVVLIAGQLLVGRRTFWLPQWLLRRSMSGAKLEKGIKWLTPPAKFIDRLLKPRLTFMIHSSGQYAIALICLAIALVIPAMELVPFLATLAGAALMIYGLSLVAYDGALAIVAMLLTLSIVGLFFYTMMG